MSQPVEVAVAVLTHADGRVLLAQRPEGKVYAGYWEFPGGKVEPGETVAQALAREIEEELGVQVERAFPWITQVFTYPHATVRLHFHRVFRWQGEPRAVEHSALAWQRPDTITVSPLLPANGPVLKGLLLPEEYAISAAGVLGVEVFLQRLQLRLASGLRLIQLREKGMHGPALEQLATKVLQLARSHGARLLINADIELARRIGADGVHLTAGQLVQLQSRPDVAWVGASCHTAQEIRAAEALEADFVVLGPVFDTPTHPDAMTLGWDGFAELARGALLPVYALGGIKPRMLDAARERGAHGLAMISGSWLN